MSFWAENSDLIWFVAIWAGIHLLFVHCYGCIKEIGIYTKMYNRDVVYISPIYSLTVFTRPYNLFMRSIGIIAVIITAIDYIKFDFENDFTDARLTWLVFLGIFNIFYHASYWYYYQPQWCKRRYCTCCIDYEPTVHAP